MNIHKVWNWWSGAAGGSPAVDPPVNTAAPSISGTAAPGQTLTVSNGTWSGVGISYTYQWYRENVVLTGETASTYVVRNNDLTTDIHAVVTATNLGGSDNASASSVQVFAASYETEYAAIQTYATSNALTQPSAVEREFENRLVKFFKSIAVWAAMDFFHNYHTGGASGYSLINWKNPGTNNATVVNSPTFTNYLGWTFNGTTQYLNTNFTPSTHASAGSQNNTSVGVYIASNTNSSGHDLSVIQSTRRILILARSSDQSAAAVNDNSVVTTSGNTQAVGMYHAFRTVSTSSNLHRNGRPIYTAGGGSSTGLSTQPIYLGARNNNGSPDSYSDRAFGCAWFGSAMSAVSPQISIGHRIYRQALQESQARAAFGTILNDSFARSSLSSTTADMIANTANWTVDGAKLTATGGSGVYTDRLVWRYGQAFEEYTQVISGALTVAPSATTRGIGVGVADYSSPDVERSVIARVNFDNASTGYVYIYFYDGSAGTQKAISASGLPFVSGDTYQLTLQCEIVAGYRKYTATVVRNGGSSVSCEYTTVNHAEGSSSGDFALFNFGGTQTVTSWTITVDDEKQVKDVWIGDSITHGHGATTLESTFAYQVSSGYDFTVSAGNGDVTQTALSKLRNILDINPHRVFLMIGGNDVALGVSSATYQANYQALRDALVGHGIEVVHLLATPRDATDMTSFNSWISSTFASDLIIDTFTPLASGTALNNTYDFGDGTHLNQAGYDLVAATIEAAL